MIHIKGCLYEAGGWLAVARLQAFGKLPSVICDGHHLVVTLISAWRRMREQHLYGLTSYEDINTLHQESSSFL